MSLSNREAVTRRIRESTDIVDVIGSYVALRRAGTNFKGLCPFHQEKTPSFTVHPDKQIFKCFGCGAGGDVFKFIQLREKVDFLQARAILAERAHISLDEDRAGGNQGFGKADIAKVNQWALDFFRRQFIGTGGTIAREYSDRRGISPEMREAFAIGFAPDGYENLVRAAKASKVPDALLAASGLVRTGQRPGYYDTFRNRLMFPIVDAMSRIIGFGGRALGDDPAKYLNTPENTLFAKGQNVFGLNRAKDAMAKAGRAIVVEGYMDCLMAHQYGFDETIATLGTAFTTEQAQLIRRFTDTVILVFDSDEAGAKAADRALSVSLLQNLDVRLARVPTGKDPCDFLAGGGKEDFATLLNEAPTAVEFRWRQVERRYNGNETGPARRRAVDEFLEQVASWVNAGAVDAIQRGLILNQVAKLLALPPVEVHGRVTSLQRRATRSPAPTGKTATGNEAAIQLAGNADTKDIAIRELVEVLLCEPIRVAHVREAIETRVPADPVLARIAATVLEWCLGETPEGEPQLADLIGRFEEPAFGRIITDLQAKGQARGNYDATVAASLELIREADRIQETVDAARQASHPDRDAAARAMAAVQEGGRAHRHFAPMSVIRPVQ